MAREGECGMKSFLCSIFMFFILCSNTHCAEPARGKVVYAGTYGNGDVYVALSVRINEVACPQSRFDIPAQHPNAKEVLATAYTAMVTGKDIIVVTNGCYNMWPTLDNSRNTYFLIWP